MPIEVYSYELVLYDRQIIIFEYYINYYEISNYCFLFYIFLISLKFITLYIN